MMTEDEAMKELAKAAIEAFHNQFQDRFPQSGLDVDDKAKLVLQRVYNAVLGVVETLSAGTVNHILAKMLAHSGCKEMYCILKKHIEENSKSN